MTVVGFFQIRVKKVGQSTGRDAKCLRKYFCVS